MQEGWESSPFLEDTLKAWNWDQIVENQKRVLGFAKDNGIPVVFLELFGSGGGETLAELEETLDGDYKRIEKIGQSGFVQTVNRAERKTEERVLETHLHSLGTRKLIVMGHHKYECVYANAFHGAEKGFQILTSNDLLIGSTEEGIPDELRAHPITRARVDQFYQDKVQVYGSVDDLLSHL